MEKLDLPRTVRKKLNIRLKILYFFNFFNIQIKILYLFNFFKTQIKALVFSTHFKNLLTRSGSHQKYTTSAQSLKNQKVDIHFGKKFKVIIKHNQNIINPLYKNKGIT